ncbi:MAG: hypothetical protein MI863_16010 [Desulfobacterales bacterium]|nr:hypothetical protein [Desulfobacterales bacterium]
MADPTLEEESLISQDDIDKLLDASSIEEAEEQIDAGDADDAAGDGGLDDIGELSQDDIDNLLSGSALDGDDSQEDIPDDNSDIDTGGELSQDDIDSLMGGNDAEEDDGGELSQDDIDSLMGGGDPEEDDGGELSQDDIDSLMGGGVDTDEESDDEDDMELISQDDIDRLMNPAEDESASEPDDDDDELISMDDIQGIMEEDDGEGGEPDPDLYDADSLEDSDLSPPEEDQGTQEITGEIDDGPDDDGVPAADDRPGEDQGMDDPLDEVIDTSDALEVNDCLITQETMDELIRNAPDPEAAGEDDDLASLNLDDPEPEDSSAGDPVALDDDDGPDTVDLDEDTDLGLDESLTDGLTDDLDNILDDEETDLNLDLEGEVDGDVTQEDIDALLQESDDDDFLDDDDDILISQDDIDTLLMAADQEDEDVLGDLLGEESDSGMDDDFDAEDIMESVGMDEDEADQVVLEGADEPEEGDRPEGPSKLDKVKGLLKSKLVLASVSAILVLGISVPAAYFLFFSSKPAPLPERESVPMAALDEGRDIEVASVTIEEEQLPAIKQSGTIVLTDFVILASDLSKEMTYVYADISIDYSDQRAYHEISNNLSFYRDLIYESIQTNLVSEKRNEVTESDLIWGVETSLKKVLPPHYIEGISFKTFRTS